MIAKKNDEDERWILDSGATSHFCSRPEWLKQFVPENRTVNLANEGTAKSIGSGEIQLLSHATGYKIKVRDVLCVPSLRGNLISVSKIVQNNNNTVVFDSNEAKVISATGKVVAIAKAIDNFYYLEVDTVVEETNKVSLNQTTSENKIAYRVYDPSDRQIHEVKHVTFHENKKGSDILKQDRPTTDVLDLTYEIVHIMPSITSNAEPTDRQNDREDNVHENEHTPQDEHNAHILKRSERLRRQVQTKGLPNYNEDYPTESDSDEPEIRVATEIRDHESELTPKTFNEAMSGPHRTQWFHAMQSEINSLKAHGVWKMIKRKKNKKVIISKWVYKFKRKSVGSVNRFKARLVGVGCAQRPGQDFDKTFSPVVRLESLRTLLGISKLKKNTNCVSTT